MSNPSVERFREKLHKPFLITGPSGHKYVIKLITPMDLIKGGLKDIPNDFYKFILSVTSGAPTGLTEEQEKANYELFEKYISIIVGEGIIDPPCTVRYTPETENTKVLWAEIPQKDQEYIVSCISGRVEDKTEQPKDEADLRAS